MKGQRTLSLSGIDKNNTKARFHFITTGIQEALSLLKKILLEYGLFTMLY